MALPGCRTYFFVLLQESCTSALEKYGVGSCGPRGFYGTIGKQIKVIKEADFKR